MLGHEATHTLSFYKWEFVYNLWEICEVEVGIFRKVDPANSTIGIGRIVDFYDIFCISIWLQVFLSPKESAIEIEKNKTAT